MSLASHESTSHWKWEKFEHINTKIILYKEKFHREPVTYQNFSYLKVTFSNGYSF